MLARKALAGTAAAPKLYVEDVMSCFLYTGNGSTQTITNNIDLSGKGGLVWTKSRGSSALGNELTDTVRGAGLRLISNTTAAQGGANSSDTTGFTSSGFELTYNNGLGNSTGQNYASWTFRKAEKFFDVVTFTTNSNSGGTFNHSLGSAPGCIIIKRTDGTANWFVWHRGLTSTNYYTKLNGTDAEINNGSSWISSTSTSVTIADNGPLSFSSAHVAYLFAHDAGGFGTSGSDNVISCGSFTTDGSGNATVNLGYEPQWLLVKNNQTASSWYIFDVMRGFSQTSISRLFPNNSNAESTQSGNYYFPTATGFQIASGFENPSETYIYIAIRRGPMKTPTTGTSVYNAIARAGTGAAATVTGVGFPPDLLMSKIRDSTVGTNWSDRLRGSTQNLDSSSTGAEATSANRVTELGQDGFSLGTASEVNTSGFTYINWNFRRAPGFFDVVCYTGTGANRTVSHNLGVAPELMIVACRSSGEYWPVYSSQLGASKALLLQLTGDDDDYSANWNSTAPTSSVFSVDADNRVNASGSTYVAYLFASLSGVSKIGTYTGNGSSVTVTTDFQPRFILVKRTNSTGDWIFSDSARGLVAGNDPFLKLNSTAAEVTNEDWVDITSTSFTVNQTTNNANVNTGTYLYLAIA